MVGWTFAIVIFMWLLVVVGMVVVGMVVVGMVVVGMVVEVATGS